MGELARTRKKIGVAAAWGRYPVCVVKALKEQGYEVHCCGVRGLADEELKSLCDSYYHVGMCQFGKIIRIMKRHHVSDVIMMGKYYKWLLFQPRFFFSHLPDFTTLCTFIPHFITRKKDCKDDTLMLRVINLFKRHGINVGVPTDYAPELLVREGVLTKRKPSPLQWRDIMYGWNVARDLGKHDVGQCVLVANGVAVAVEGMEGTDRCILRAAQLAAGTELTLVKIAKPTQDMRFDVPTVGMNTLENCLKAHVTTVALEAGRTILVEQREVIQYADEHKIALVALNPSDSAIL